MVLISLGVLVSTAYLEFGKIGGGRNKHKNILSSSPVSLVGFAFLSVSKEGNTHHLIKTGDQIVAHEGSEPDSFLRRS